MKILCVIPARYNSERLMGKPLEMIGDKSLIQWVYESASKSTLLDKIIVATDDERIFKEVLRFGGDVEMTSLNHISGTDRIAEVAKSYEEYDVVINVQGDQPFITVDMLKGLINPFLENKSVKMSTIAAPINLDNKETFENPNNVKVVVNKEGKAIYFSRASIPYFRKKLVAPVYHHIGLYAYDREFLLEFSMLESSNLELCEGLEQLRVIENGYDIYVEVVDGLPLEVNTPEDLTQIRKYYIENKGAFQD